MPYRRDIDGLRAIAVLSVILSHAGFEQFKAGIVGVDMFFVISGFLITGIILGQQQRGEFRLRDFYERRARRILPALALILVCTTVAAWLFQLPWELTRFGQSLVSVVTFSSNIYFYLTTNYFSPSAETQPLIHTWSLAVEEQFYVLYPLLLIALHRFSRRTIFNSLVSLLLASSVLWVLVHDVNAPFAFYMLPTRGWQLLLGAVVAVRMSQQATMSAPHEAGVGALSLVGLLLLAIAVTGTASNGMNQHGVLLQSTLATVGTGLVLAFGRAGNLTFLVLSTRPLAFIGLISYSAYLWHQPVFALARQLSQSEPSTPTMIGLIGFVFLLATISWKYIEIPFRRPAKASLRQMAWTLLPALGLCLCFGLMAHARKGELWRHPTELAQVFKALNVSLNCSEKQKFENPSGLACRIGTRSTPPRTAIWGDSHARALAQGIQALQSPPRKSIMVYTMSGCAPVIGEHRPTDTNDDIDCRNFNQRVLREITAGSIATVVLVARWATSIEPPYLDQETWVTGLDGARLEKRPKAMMVSTELEKARYLESDLRQTAKALLARNKKVALLLPWPEMPWDVPGRAFNQMRLSKPDELVLNPPILARQAVNSRQARTRDVIMGLAAELQIPTIDPLLVLCDEIACQTGLGKDLWYWDDDHLSVTGISRLFQLKIIRELFASPADTTTELDPIADALVTELKGLDSSSFQYRLIKTGGVSSLLR